MACWTTGDLGGRAKENWGWNEELKDSKEFTVDRVGDLGNRVPDMGSYLPLALIDERDELDEWDLDDLPPYLIPFGSFPEAIDYTFTMDPHGRDKTVGDKRKDALKNLLVGAPVGDEWDPPWKDRNEYFARRSLGADSKERVTVSRAKWDDDQNPSGGLTTDFAKLLEDERAERANLFSGTRNEAGDGGRVILETSEMPALEIQSSGTMVCTGNSCSYTPNLTATTVNVAVTSSAVDINDGESFRNILDKGERPIVVDQDGTDVIESLEVDLSNVSESTLDDHLKTDYSYARFLQPDLVDDEISVTLELNPEFRRDYQWDGSRALGKVLMRGLGAGNSVWTYDAYGDNYLRHADLNDGSLPHEGQIDSLVHAGYRQPSLSAVYGPAASFLTPEPVRHIRWPVNIQDLNWYLYELPGKNHEDPWWFLWLTDEGAKRVVEEGYGDSAVPAVPPEDHRPDCELDGKELLVEKIECKDLPGGAYFPFQAGDSSPGLNPEMLVRQGVESPADIDDLGPRNLSVFSFAVKEAEPMGRASQSGEAVMRRYGVPLDRGKRENYFNEWARKPIDPTRSYLLVFTYYESLNPNAIGGRGIMFQKSDKGGDRYRLPKRHIRRVVCRMLVSPSGFTPAADQGFNPIRTLGNKVKGAIGDGLDVMAGWVGGLLRGVLHFPGWAVKQGGALTCGGLEKVDELTAAAAMERAGARVGWEDGEPVMFVNAAVRSRTEGFENCVRVSAPVVPTCESSNDVIFQGRCVQLPRVRLSPEKVSFVDLHAEEEYQRWETVWEKPESEVGNPVLSYGQEAKSRSFQPSFDVGLHTIIPVSQGQDLKPPAPDNVGLTRVSLGWEFLGGDDSPDLRRAIKGYVVYVWPDPKSSDLPEGEGWAFILPSWVKAGLKSGGGSSGSPDDTGSTRYYKIDGFNVGDLDHYGSPGSKTTSSNSLVSLEADYGENSAEFKPLGSEVVKSNYGWFVDRVGNLPLAPGFSHRFAVAPYIGEPGYPSFALGPVSESVVLDGDKAACLAGESAAEGSISEEEWRHIRELYDCRGAEGGLDGGYVDDTFRVGLLGLTGTRLCYDIFSSTPPEFTWDNPIVRQVWALVWIIAGGVLFALLVWQGLRMTYDVWLEPRPSVGFRELVPRFLLAVALAAGSLYIAQFVLILASDLTCFVAQVTGMTMWGLVGNTFGALLDGFLAWHTSFRGRRRGHAPGRAPEVGVLRLGAGRGAGHLRDSPPDTFHQGRAGHADAHRASGGAHCPVSFGLCLLRFGDHVPLDQAVGLDVPGDHLPAGLCPGGGLHRGPPGGALHGGRGRGQRGGDGDRVPSGLPDPGTGGQGPVHHKPVGAGTVRLLQPVGEHGGGGHGDGGGGGLGRGCWAPGPGRRGRGAAVHWRRGRPRRSRGGPWRRWPRVWGRRRIGGRGACAGRRGSRSRRRRPRRGRPSRTVLQRAGYFLRRRWRRSWRRRRGGWGRSWWGSWGRGRFRRRGGVSRRASRHGGGDGGRDGGGGPLRGGSGGGTGCCCRRTGWGCQRRQRRRSWPGGGSRVGPFHGSRGSRVVSSRRAGSRCCGYWCRGSRRGGLFRASSRYRGSFRAGSGYGGSFRAGLGCGGSF